MAFIEDWELLSPKNKVTSNAVVHSRSDSLDHDLTRLIEMQEYVVEKLNDANQKALQRLRRLGYTEVEHSNRTIQLPVALQ